MREEPAMNGTTTAPLLELRSLTTVFPTKRGLVKAVNGVDLDVAPGEILGIVGESGCGKSTALQTILRLVASPGRVAEGQVLYKGEDLLVLPPRAMCEIRGKEISMIFQDPLSTLNPVFPIGEQIREVLRLHGIIKPSRWPWPFDKTRRAQEKKRVLEMMAEVGIPAPDSRYGAYPHEFSGGMQQRALIAIGLVCEGDLLLADEPTTALDVTIQAQIIELMRGINQNHGTSIILVTHNLGLAAEFCDSIAVMYAGRIVERGPADEIVEEPKHPYTQGLLACLPQMADQKRKVDPIPGNVPDLAALPAGCAFAARCPRVRDECRTSDVPLVAVTPRRVVRCILYEPNPR